MPAQKCCRTSPRCASCPARLLAQRRVGKRPSGVAGLVEEILIGAPPRPLPVPVVRALATLDAARAR